MRGKNEEAGDLLQVWSLLRKILPSTTNQKKEKTRGQVLADRVRLRSQGTTHEGQIEKLELDLQRHRDIQGVLSRVRVEQGNDMLARQLLRKCTAALWKKSGGDTMLLALVLKMTWR